MSHEKLEKSVKMILSPGKVSVLRTSFVKKKNQNKKKQKNRKGDEIWVWRGY